MENEGMNYNKLISAQNESARRFKIKQIQNTLTDENKKKRIFAILSGICCSGVLLATHFSGVDPNQAINTEIQALGSFEALKDYLSMITPAMYASIIASATSISSFIKHRKAYNRANTEFYDMMDTEPTDYLKIVESQADER